MVGMVVVGPMAHDDVGLPCADEPRHRLAVFERGRQFAVVDVHHFGLDPENAGAFGDFRLAPACQRAAGRAEVADVAVGHRDELDLVPGRSPERRDAARLQLGIVGMGAEGDDAKGLGLCEGGRISAVACKNGTRENEQAAEPFHGSPRGPER